MMTLVFWIILFLLHELTHSAFGNVQSFVVSPSNMTVVVGQTVILKCQVANKRGSLQWTKDGFALGFDRQIPGYLRYRMDGSEARGEHHLIIENIQLEDDSEFQCQVGPAAGNPALLGRAFLSVIVAPKLPFIEGYTNGSIVEASQTQSPLNLTCIAREGKPAATFKWFRGSVELKEGVMFNNSVEVLGNKLENGISVLTLIPGADDNNVVYSCQAFNPAMLRPTIAAVKLNVQHPPGIPEISVYDPDRIIKTGDTVRLVCVSRGGNPLAQLHWYRNGVELDFSYTTGNNRAENELIVTMQPSDNNASYECQASNPMTPQPLARDVRLTVQFAPEKVTITGHRNAIAGELVTLKCESAISNPAAVIVWYSRGQQVQNAVSRSVPSPQGGYVTLSEIRVIMTNSSNDVGYQCQGTNEALGKMVTDMVSLTVMYPPGQPTIEGYSEGSSLSAETVLIMTCMSTGGNPLANLTWMKGDKVLEGVRLDRGNWVSSQVSMHVKREDNNAVCRCFASNDATPTPLISVVRLKVNFPPKSLNVTLHPKVVRSGQRLTITCKSSSSNPPALLSWWKNGSMIAGTAETFDDAEFGGRSTVSRLEVSPGVTDHGEIYACRATNEALKQTISDAATLNVLHPPYFPPGSPSRVDVVEGEWAVLNLTATGNPSDITYTWFFRGRQLVLGRFRRDSSMSMLPVAKENFKQDGPILNLTDVTRADHGTYECRATNAEGNTTYKVLINVSYPAEIVSTSPERVINRDEPATLECKVLANPLDAMTVTWKRLGFDMNRANVEFDSGTSRLKIASAVREDSGGFQCVANNGIGEPVSKLAVLLVKHAPIIDRAPTSGKSAAAIGQDAVLICRAKGVPAVQFVWFKDQPIPLSNQSQYMIDETSKVDIFEYESRLIIYNSSSADWGKYRCNATNDLGFDSGFISFHGISTPDAPYDLHFINATHNSITLSWKAGFDGGAAQRFQVVYNPVGVEGKKYEDVIPPEATIYTIKGLKLDTNYEITVKGVNELGSGPFQEQLLRAGTSGVDPMPVGDDIPLIIILAICIVGLLILALNIILILFFIRRRRKKLEKDGSESASQANTLEMFNAPVMVDDSSKSFTTFDHRSLEDFQDEFKTPFEVSEDGRYYGPPGDQYYPGSYGRGQGGSPQADQSPYHPDLYRGSHPVGSGSREGLYPNGMTNPSWDGGFRGPFTGGSLPPDGEDYAEQLRKMQKNQLGQPGARGSAHLPSSLPYAPTPPIRSSSKGAVDGLVGQRPPYGNYDNTADDPRYISSPESMYSSTRSQRPASQLYLPSSAAPPELRGHLV